MSYEVSTNVGYGSKLKINADYFDAEKDISDDEGVISGIFGNACSGGPDYGCYVMIKDTAPLYDISQDKVMENNFTDWCIKIPNVEQYQLDLWRDKITVFCAKRNIEFEEPTWMVVTFGG